MYGTRPLKTRRHARPPSKQPLPYPSPLTTIPSIRTQSLPPQKDATTHTNQDWSEQSHLDLMHKVNISKSILSISSPGTHLVAGNAQLASTLTRYCNSYAASLKKNYPARFGFWASLPLPDIQASLTEIPLAIADHCDGFALETNHHGHYLGDPIFEPVFAELDRRGAVVFVHPTTPCIACVTGTESTATPMKAAPLHAKIPNPMLEFFFDTARCVTNLFLSGTVARYPRITYVIPHAGGALPPVLSRFTGFSTLVPGPWTGISEVQARKAFQKQFYFDLAGFVFPARQEGEGRESVGDGQLVGLVKGVGVGSDRLLYGSDFPFTKAGGVEWLVGIMDEGVKQMFTEEEVRMIYRGNAERLLGGSGSKI